MLNFMNLARSGDQVIGVHLEMKRLGICPFSVEKLLFHCFEKADQTGGVRRYLIHRRISKISTVSGLAQFR